MARTRILKQTNMITFFIITGVLNMIISSLMFQDEITFKWIVIWFLSGFIIISISAMFLLLIILKIYSFENIYIIIEKMTNELNDFLNKFKKH